MNVDDRVQLCDCGPEDTVLGLVVEAYAIRPINLSIMISICDKSSAGPSYRLEVVLRDGSSTCGARKSDRCTHENDAAHSQLYDAAGCFSGCLNLKFHAVSGTEDGWGKASLLDRASTASRTRRTAQGSWRIRPTSTEYVVRNIIHQSYTQTYVVGAGRERLRIGLHKKPLGARRRLSPESARALKKITESNHLRKDHMLDT